MFRSQRPFRASFQPAVECLESRQLLAASASVLGRELIITGTNQADTIQINQEYILTGFMPVQREMGVRVTIDTTGVPTYLRYFTRSQFDLIKVDALDGNDRVTNQSAYDSVLTGGVGRDSLTGGTGNDSLTGGHNNDVINGGGGYDVLVERGNVNMTLTDTSLTGLGTDTLIAIDAAHLTGGVGDNTIDCRGFTGRVTLHGGNGADVLHGGSNNDELYGEGDDGDQLFGNAGDDYMEGGSGADVIVGGEGANDHAKDSFGDRLVNLSVPGHGIEKWTDT